MDAASQPKLNQDEPTRAEAEQASFEAGAKKLNEAGKGLELHPKPERGQVEALNELGKNLNLQAESGAQEFEEKTKSWLDRAKGMFKRGEGAPIKGEEEILKELEKADAVYADFKKKYDEVMASGDAQALRGMEGSLAQAYDQLAPQVAAEQGSGMTEAGAKLNDVTRRLTEVRAKLNAPSPEQQAVADAAQREIETLSDPRQGWTAETAAAIADATARRDAALAPSKAPESVAPQARPTADAMSLNEVLTGKEAPMSLEEKEASLAQAGMAGVNELGKDLNAPAAAKAVEAAPGPTPEEARKAQEAKTDARYAATREKLLATPGIKGTPAEKLVDDYVTLLRHGRWDDADGEVTGLSFDSQEGMIKVTYANGNQVRKYANGLILRVETGGKVEKIPAEPPRENQAVEQHAYKNAEGKESLLAEVRLDQQGDEMDVPMRYAGHRSAQELLSGKPPVVKARRLQEIELASPENGKVVKLLESLGLQDVEIYVADERLKNYYYDPATKRVMVPPLESALDLGIALHELGHADQDRDERLAGLTEDSYLTYEKILTAVPEARSQFDLEKIRAYTESNLRLNKLGSEVGKLEQAALAGEPVDAAEMEAKRQEFLKLYQETETLRRDARAEDLLRLPQRILERDATARALNWARKLRSQGVDLLGAMRAPKEASVKARPEDDCSRSVDDAAHGGDEGEVVLDIAQNLKAALKTYGADKSLPMPRARDRMKAAGEIEAAPSAAAAVAPEAPAVAVSEEYAQEVQAGIERATPKTSDQAAEVSGEIANEVVLPAEAPPAIEAAPAAQAAAEVPPAAEAKPEAKAEDPVLAKLGDAGKKRGGELKALVAGGEKLARSKELKNLRSELKENPVASLNRLRDAGAITPEEAKTASMDPKEAEALVQAYVAALEQASKP